MQRHGCGKLRQQVVGGDDGEFSVASLLGDETELSDVLDELSTVALFGGGQRLVIIEDADGFVSQNRAALEQYVAKPKRGSVLVLLVKTWPGNTRLAKSVAETGLAIECKCPPPARLAKWLVAWAQATARGARRSPAADVLMEHVEPDLGLLDQELAKLAAMAGAGGTITAELVEEGVGGWRAKTAWDLFDAALAGQTTDALVQLDRLLLAGEAPIALMGQLSASLRRFGSAVRVLEQAELTGQRGMNLRQALERAGVKSFVLPKAEGQLRRLGRARRAQIFAGCSKPTWLSKVAVLPQPAPAAAGRIHRAIVSGPHQHKRRQQPNAVRQGYRATGYRLQARLDKLASNFQPLSSTFNLNFQPSTFNPPPRPIRLATAGSFSLPSAPLRRNRPNPAFIASH